MLVDQTFASDLLENFTSALIFKMSLSTNYLKVDKRIDFRLNFVETKLLKLLKPSRGSANAINMISMV